MKNQLLSTLLIFAFSITAFAQEIVYTVSARFGLQTIALDSILIENLTNHSRLLFTNLPNFESYEINLTSQTIGDVETGINIGNQGLSDFVVVQNQPGLMVLNYHGTRSLDVRVSVVNLNGQVSYISDNKTLGRMSTLSIQLGHPGVYLVKVESEGGVQTFKAIGTLSGQSLKVSQGNVGKQSLGLKSSGDSDIDEFSFVTGDELRLTAYKNGYYASPKTLIVSVSQQIEFEFRLINIIRGGPAETNPMAVPIQIAGVSADPYSSNLNQWTGSWEAPQSIYDQDIYVNDPDNWSNILGNSDAGTTWSNLSPGIGYGILVVDLEHAREITSVSVFQMFSDGKITHIALAGHPEINSTAPDALDEDWYEFLPKSIVGAGTDGVSYVYNPTKYFVEAQTRYVKIMAFNDGSYGNSSYIELKGIKMYGGVANSFTLSLEVFPEGSGLVSGDGLYSEGTQVEIMATPNEGYTFINWTGDTEYIDDSNVPNSTLMMPAKNIMLTAIFEGNNGEGDATEVVEVLNPVTGRIWMDRNLGASRAAISSNDEDAYGHLFQWGRAADGHQIRTSNTTELQSNSDNPDHGDFILGSNDWRSPQHVNLWQDVNGINNPCPVGYRLPTEAELNAERLSWGSNNAAGAYTSPLKLPVAGARLANNGSLHAVGSWGNYWSSTLDGTDSRLLTFGSSDAHITNHHRAEGRSVRCIQDLEVFGHTLNIDIHPAGSGIVDKDPVKEEYFEGELVTLNANPSTGYVFSNWTGDTEYLTDSDNAETTLTMPAQDVLLTANFQIKNPNLYSLTLIANPSFGGSVNGAGAYAVNVQHTIIAKPNAGFIFVNWSGDTQFLTNPDQENTILIMPAQSVTLTAFFEIITSAINYNLDGGVNHEDNPHEFTIENLPITLRDAVKEGYKFDGWYDNAQFKGEPLTEITNTINVDLWAKFDIITQTITYSLNGGINHENNPDEFTIEGLPIILQDAVKEGFAFEGWYDNAQFTGEPVTEITQTGDIHLWAKFDIITHGIIYNLDGGVNHEDNPHEFTVEGLPIILQDAVKEGFTFEGWYDNSQCTGEAVTQITQMSDVGLWAKFDIITHGIIYNLDGGMNHKDNPDNFTIGDLPIALQDAIKDGYCFDGWYDNAEFTGEPIIQISQTSDVELWAYFFENSVWLNLIRGGPAETNPMAIPIQITGVSADPYKLNLNQWIGGWEAPQAIYDQGRGVNDPDNWSNILGNSSAGTTWLNSSPGIGYGILVVDLQQAREITNISVFQMFRDGKITHIALAGHPEASDIAPEALNEDWVEFLPISFVEAGTNGNSYVYNPTKFVVDAQTRFVKIMAFNDGSHGDPNFIEIKGIKFFGEFPYMNLTTTNVTEINNNSARISGSLSMDQNTEIASKGFVYSESPNPDITNNFVSSMDESGNFDAQLFGLKHGTRYYIKTFVEYDFNIFYGNELTFKTTNKGDGIEDIDGNNYETVLIGHQEWMRQNLRTTSYNNNAQISRNASRFELEIKNEGAYFIYPHEHIEGIENDEEMVSKYGLLYDWYAIQNASRLCPSGWRVPTDNDWTMLVNFVGGLNHGGGRLKSTRISPVGHPHWLSPNLAATDEYNFSALPGGSFSAVENWFLSLGKVGSWWSSTESNEENAFYRYMYYNFASITQRSMEKQNGLSVRCIRDTYKISTLVYPKEAGSIEGGETYYDVGEEVQKIALPNPGFEFDYWMIDDEIVSEDPVFVYTTTNKDVLIKARFRLENSEVVNGPVVTDVSGNIYKTIIIGNQTWFARNLRVTRYRNGAPILTGHTATEWKNLTEGAYAVYPHSELFGLESEAEVLEAYGALYNWYAVNDERGLCPVGWRIPEMTDWDELRSYMVDNFDAVYLHFSPFEWNNMGAFLMSCRHTHSPWGGECQQTEHPRWSYDFGSDDFGFNALPGGYRLGWNSMYLLVGVNAYWWSSTQNHNQAYYRELDGSSGGRMRTRSTEFTTGCSVRCIRE